MFKLQRLEITGFKSFANHTEILFTGEGITGIVGPNGCGKSNVADAIAWVLGEQRAKQLRGAEMKDVIFQGSRNRPPGGMAEVVLHLTRDESVTEEADIEDIDSSLEEIDDHSEALEARSASPAIEATGTTEEATVFGTNSAEATSLSTVSTGDFTLTNKETEKNNQPGSVDSPVSAEAVLGQEGGAEAAAANARVAASTSKARGTRHWRPSRLALGFAPGETVSVTRRLYRSGESEYLLNGRACRLRDIQDLFSGTGLAGAHYAIIEQGRIGQILSAKPLDRRALVEEAAGITKFRVRQRAAESRLEAARANLRRVSDIVQEIERQTGSLRRQATKARRYEQLREELRELLRRVYAADRDALSILLDKVRVLLTETSSEEQRLAEELKLREEEARGATAAARACEEALAGARQTVAGSVLQRDRCERERTYQEEQAANFAGRSASITGEMELVQARLTSVEGESEALRVRDVQLRGASEETARLLQAAEAAYAERGTAAVTAEAHIEAARTELLTHTAVAERLMEIGRQLDSALDRLALQAEGFARERERAHVAHQTAQAEAEKLNAAIEAASERLAQLAAERGTAAHEVEEARALAAEAAVEHSRIRDNHVRTRHRLDTLIELDEQHAYYSEAVQRIFSTDTAPKDFHSIGTLADALQVEPQWEAAVESVFGHFLQSVIVPTPEDAVRACVWSKEHKVGRATFLVAGLHGASSHGTSTNGRIVEQGRAADGDRDGNGGAMLAEGMRAADADDAAAVVVIVQIGDVLGASPEILEVMKRTLPREMRACVAASVDDAMSRSLKTGEMYVTVEGEWVAGGQLLTAASGSAQSDGSATSTAAAGGLLAFKREMRELEAFAAELQQIMIKASGRADAAHARLSELEEAILLLNDKIGREEREQMGRELNAVQLTGEIERAERHLRVIADDAARLELERRELEERRATSVREAEAAEAARQESAQKVAEAADLLLDARRAADLENERLSEQRAAAATAAERRRATTAELRRMETEGSDLTARLERYKRELIEATTRAQELRRSIGELKQTAITIERERAAQEQEVEQRSARLVAAREVADGFSLKLAELNRAAAATREYRASLEVQRAEAAARLTYLRETCIAELAQPLDDLPNVLDTEEGFDLESARGRVDELRARVESFGAVNMMALEELAEAEQRFAFLTGQRQDITDGIISTEEALREIKRRSRERFREAFEEINSNFSTMFAELFGGGRGEMNLIDADDVLESGIDIIAQPPGKRLQNVLLLSGGEKAMAALALVLAVFRYRPSPFCLLDEVDAPLDEANIGRFTSKIAEMATNTQFLVVTHNKRTMEIARALYGVTMEEPGVSKLVSVKFE